MAGDIHVVETSEGLYQAIQDAVGGDRIELAPGDYGDININNIDFDSEVIITSQDKDAPAVFNTAMLSGASNITFDNVFFDFTPDSNTVKWSSALRADNSSNITVVNSRFEGGPPVAGIPVDSEPGTQGAKGIEGMPIGRAIAFHWSDNIVIENNEISQFASGVRFTDVVNVTFNSNEIHDFRQVPVGGGNVSNLTMENNYFHDANPWKFGGLGDHGDFVHFWSRGPDSAVSENHYYAGNIFDQGEGAAILGIYLDDNGNEVGFKNVVIENNVIYNGNAQALRMENVDDLKILNNTLLQSSGDEQDAPMIRLAQNSENVVIEGNIFGGVVGPDLENADRNNIVIGDNLTVQIHDPNGENYYGELFVTSAASVFDIQAIPGELADGIGSNLTQFNWNPGTLTPNFQVSSDEESTQTLIFDASLTAGPLGPISASDAEFQWDFGDGNTATGQIVEYDFANPGHHGVTLTVTTKDGTSAQTQVNVGISGDGIVQFDAQAGRFEALAFGEETPLDSGGMPLDRTADGYVLDLGGKGTQASIASSNLSHFFGTDSFEMSMSLKADSLTSWGEVARIHVSFTAFVDQDGNFAVTLFPEGGDRVTIKSTGVAMNDGNWHDVTVKFDGKAGFADLIVDGQAVGSGNVSGSLGGGVRSLDFGNPTGKQNFDGELSAFSLSTDSRDFPVYDGEKPPELTPPDTETGVDDNDGSSGSNHDTDVPVPADPETSDDANLPGDPTAPVEEEESSLPPPPPSSMNLYALNLSTIEASDTIKLHDGVKVVEAEHGSALSFDGVKDCVTLGRLTEFETSQKLAFSVDFVSDNAGGGSERLVWNHLKLGLTLQDDKLQVHAGNNDDPFWRGFLIDDMELRDGDRHSVTVMVDAEADRLQVVVDDVLVLDEQATDFDFVGAGGHEWGWSLGTAWDHWFEGEVHDFQISDDFGFVEQSPVDDGLLAV